jgi:hypothetical protein
MRTGALLLVLLGIAACDDKPTSATPAPTSTESAATATATAAATATATATASAAGVVRPPRPVPIGSSGPIQPSAPPEQQMMAIAYTLSLVTPQGNDPLTVDQAYLDEYVKKLEVAVRGIDKGTTPPNAAKATKGNRKIEVDMGHGCVDYVPSQLVKRAGTTLKAAYDAGVLVISCHDDKWECHQSTRDPKDVLCHAAPGAMSRRPRH